MTAILRKPIDQEELKKHREKAEELRQRLTDVQANGSTPVPKIQAIAAELAEVCRRIEELRKGAAA
jgi:uncharacterized coiled-coil DUF342 family protein